MALGTWLITGVSSGFGRELAQQLLERGDRVVGTVRDTSKVADLTDRYPDTFIAEVLEMTDRAAVRQLIDRCFERLGRIDVVVSNAASGASKASAKQSPRKSHPSASASRSSNRAAHVPSSATAALASPRSSLNTMAIRPTRSRRYSTRPTDSLRVTQPGWPPAWSTASTSTQHRCA